MKCLILSLSALMIGGFLSTATATTMEAPKDCEVKSPNGKFVLKVHSDSGVHQLCTADPEKPGQTKTLWQFQHAVSNCEYYVSDDGKYVMWVASEYVQVEEAAKQPAVVVFSTEGKVVKKTYAQVSNPRPYAADEIGPIGDFWRIWRDNTKREGELVTIEVTGKPAFAINLADPAKKPESN